LVTKGQFIREYLKAIRDGNAAVFAGAGLSRPSGFVLWRELLRPLADDIGLNIEYEYDLPAVAQYVRNQNGNRNAINMSILEAYSKDVEQNDNVRILTRLPIYTYWTTNYDHLIENGLAEANRKADVKINCNQLPFSKHDSDAVVYKMHGDVENVSNAVLTKDDYVQYDQKYPFFRSILQSDLISKMFLFIGFSFEDPNLDSVLGQIRSLLGENIRNHYCFMKRFDNLENISDKEFNYRKVKQDLMEKDLSRYGIQTVFVDAYSEITDILREIENALLLRNIFISGSIDFYSETWPQSNVNLLAERLANKLVKKDFKITSGFGLGIGSSVINGALSEIYSNKYKHTDKYLCLRPFPHSISDVDYKAKWKKYREDIISENGIVIFMFGNKRDFYGNKIQADGCLQEFEIAKKNGCIIIPIGSTGDVARFVLDEVKENIEKYPYLDGYLSDLENELNVDKIINLVISIIENINSFSV